MVGFVAKINPSGPSQEELWRRREKKTKEAVRDGHNIYEQSPLPLPPPQSRRRRGLELASETKTGGVRTASYVAAAFSFSLALAWAR